MVWSSCSWWRWAGSLPARPQARLQKLPHSARFRELTPHRQLYYPQLILLLRVWYLSFLFQLLRDTSLEKSISRAHGAKHATIRDFQIENLILPNLPLTATSLYVVLYSHLRLQYGAHSLIHISHR